MKRLLKRGTATLVALAVALTLFVPSAFATVPKKEDVEYLGKGKVEVEFIGHVKYKNVKVTVKDSNGNSYDTSIVRKDDDDLKFKIKNYKTGKTYTFKIKGVKKHLTKEYGTVSGKVKIPSTKNNITASKAVSIALKDAGLTKSQVRDLEVEKDREGGQTFYEVSFETSKYEYEYDISLKGKIIWKEKERD